MKSIEQIAIETANTINEPFITANDSLVKFATKFLEAYLAQQTPVYYMMIDEDSDDIEFSKANKFSCGRTDGIPLFLAPPLPKVDPELADALVLLWSSDDRAAWDKKAVEHFDALLAKVESGYLAPTAPEGYVLVPKVPTEAMYQAGRNAPCVAEDMEWREDYMAVWQAMVASGEKK